MHTQGEKVKLDWFYIQFRATTHLSLLLGISQCDSPIGSASDVGVTREWWKFVVEKTSNRLDVKTSKHCVCVHPNTRNIFQIFHRERNEEREDCQSKFIQRCRESVDNVEGISPGGRNELFDSNVICSEMCVCVSTSARESCKIKIAKLKRLNSLFCFFFLKI